jgi:hypothetical protein
MTKFFWAGDRKRLRECAFRERCLTEHGLDCPGVIDDQCWFDSETNKNKPLIGTPEGLIEKEPIPKEEDKKPLDIKIVEI